MSFMMGNGIIFLTRALDAFWRRETVPYLYHCKTERHLV